MLGGVELVPDMILEVINFFKDVSEAFEVYFFMKDESFEGYGHAEFTSGYG
jgi:hypothetical protein